jgi:hypothetical protein
VVEVIVDKRWLYANLFQDAHRSYHKITPTRAQNSFSIEKYIYGLNQYNKRWLIHNVLITASHSTCRINKSVDKPDTGLLAAAPGPLCPGEQDRPGWL